MNIVAVDNAHLTGLSMNHAMTELAADLTPNEIDQLHGAMPVGGGIGPGAKFMDNTKAGLVQLHNAFLFVNIQKTCPFLGKVLLIYCS